MILEKPKVKWPPILALYVPRMNKAYAMRFVKEHLIQKEIVVSSPGKMLALSHQYMCETVEAYYFPRVYVRPLGQKPLPEATLTVKLDEEILIERELSFFASLAEPLDCMKSYSWQQTIESYKALALQPDGNADPKRQLGFMMPTNDVLQVYLSGIRVEASLEVGILSALYSTKSKENKS